MKLYIKNPSLSFFNDMNWIYIKVNETFRCINCDFDVFKVIINKFDEPCSVDDIHGLFLKDEYSRDDVEQFVNVLVREEIIVEFEEIEYAETFITIVGEGTIAEQFIGLCKRKKQKFNSMNFGSLLDSNTIKADVVVLIEESLTLNDILKFNKKLVQLDIPFIIVRYNGQDLVVGPFVFPWKSTCFSCNYTHHLSLMKGLISENKDIYTNYSKLDFSKKMQDVFESDKLGDVLNCVLMDVNKVNQSKATFKYLNREFFYSLKHGVDNPICEKKYMPITDCDCCHGMNKKYIEANNISELVSPASFLDYDDTDIKYSVGGFRSKTLDDTKTMLEDILKRLELGIEITLIDDNPFGAVIPVYDSKLETTHKNKSPYFIEEQFSYGKGVNKTQAYFSAAFELFERISSRHYGEKEIIRGTAKQLSKYAMDVNSITKNIHNYNTPFERFDYNTPIDWVWGQSLITKEMKLVPASMAFLSSTKFRGKFLSATSSGLASGATMKDAILQGLFELVEHDAWMIGQACNCRYPKIDYSTVKNDNIKKLIKLIKDLNYNVVSRDYTNDIGIPAIRTWITNPNNYTVYSTNGFGASISAEMALERSLTEAIQAGFRVPKENVISYSAPVMREITNNRNSLYGLYYFQQKDIFESDNDEIRSMNYYPEIKYPSVDFIIKEVIARLKKAIEDLDIIVVDMTRESFGVPVVRVIITGDFQVLNVPLLSVSPRLLEFPMKMGYSDRKFRYDELYMGNYPH